MNLIISGHHTDVTDALRHYIDQKLQPLVRHFDRVVDVNIVLCVDAGQSNCQNQVEATLHVPGQNLHATSCGQDMYSAIEAVMAKLDRQVKKYKTKTSSHRGQGIREVTHDAEQIAVVEEALSVA